MAHVTTLVFFSAWTGETPPNAMESWMPPPICTLRTLRGTGVALYTVLEVLPDSQELSQAYKFDIVCFCKPSHPTRAECTLCEDRTRFDRSRYQTRPPAFPTLHQPCTTSLQHSLLLPSHLERGLGTSHASGAHWARAHTRLICHVCTQSCHRINTLPHYFPRITTPSARRLEAAQLASQGPRACVKKYSLSPTWSFITPKAVPTCSIRHRRAGFPCRRNMSRWRLQHAPKPSHRSSKSRCILA